jgi:hypothetical protein
MHASIRRCAIATLLILVLSAAATNRADAFKTFRAFGGAIHEAITGEAIGSEVSHGAFRIIDAAATTQDVPGTAAFEDPARHFVDGSLGPPIRHAQATWRRAKAFARDADRRRNMRDRALEQMGFYFHTIQDFYSHANYIEMALSTGGPPDRIRPVPLDSPNLPANLRTGYFYYDNPAQHELSVSRETAIRRLLRIYPTATFWTDDTYARMRSNPESYEQAIAYATSGRDFLHLEVDKDNAQSLQGKVVHPRSGLTLHEIARRVAVRHTREDWHRFLHEVKQDAGSRGAAVTAALTGSVGLVCPPTLGGYPLTRNPRYQGSINRNKDGTSSAACGYGHAVNVDEIHVAVFWAERPPANMSCGKLRHLMTTLNPKGGRIIRTHTSTARLAAVGYAQKPPERPEVRALAEELFRQVEARAVPCS